MLLTLSWGWHATIHLWICWVTSPCLLCLVFRTVPDWTPLADLAILTSAAKLRSTWNSERSEKKRRQVYSKNQSDNNRVARNIISLLIEAKINAELTFPPARVDALMVFSTWLNISNDCSTTVVAKVSRLPSSSFALGVAETRRGGCRNEPISDQQKIPQKLGKMFDNCSYPILNRFRWNLIQNFQYHVLYTTCQKTLSSASQCGPTFALTWNIHSGYLHCWVWEGALGDTAEDTPCIEKAVAVDKAT